MVVAGRGSGGGCTFGGVHGGDGESTRDGFGGSMVRVEYGSILGKCCEYLCNSTSSKKVNAFQYLTYITDKFNIFIVIKTNIENRWIGK